MRINELLESVFSQHHDEEKKKDDELEFDLAEDISFYLNNNDDAYRRHMYPVVTKCINRIKSNQPTHPSIFKIAVLKGFKDYSDEFPQRQLPVKLDDKMCEEICKELHEELCKHVEEGKYKD